MMKFLLQFLTIPYLLATIAVATENIVEYTSIDDIEQGYFKEVLVSCLPDVQNFCSKTATAAEVGLRRTSAEDNFDSLLTPFIVSFGDHHRSLIEEFDSFYENFIQPNNQWVVVYSSDSETQSDKKPPCHKLASAVAGMQDEHDFVHNMAINFHPSHFDVVSQRLQSHGNELLTKGSTLALSETGRRVARRLSTVTANELLSLRKSFLPFYDEQNDCLDRMYLFNPSILSNKCHQAVTKLNTYRLYLKHEAQEMEETYRSAFLGLLAAYFLTMLPVVWTIFRRGDRIKKMKDSLRLHEIILTTVYQNQDIKIQIEDKAGKSLGFEPPFLGSIRAERVTSKNSPPLFSMRSWMFTYFTGAFVAPLVTLSYGPSSGYSTIAVGVLFCFVLYQIYYATMTKKLTDPICTCCCCAMTTEMARLGTGNDAQMCCGCCKGTGVCSVECASCCSPDTDQEKVEISTCCKENIAEPEPICTCCCCDMTSEMAKLGTGSKEQECCGCCKGTGVCDPACASCCGPDTDKQDGECPCCDNYDDSNMLITPLLSSSTSTSSKCCSNKKNKYEGIQIV